ncbi:hypothetical protein ZWY2020_058695 [Hordeum vulgare]|nr:hypothetical protein ZWY2020_058695 [Hordeum vulgare]
MPLPPVEILRSPATPDASAPSEDVLLRVPGAQLHLIDRQRSHPLAAGDLSLHRIRAGDTSLAAIAALRVVQWPLARDVAAVKLDPRHYSFSAIPPPRRPGPDFHYGLTLSVPTRALALRRLHQFSTHSSPGGEGWPRCVARSSVFGPPSRPTSRRRLTLSCAQALAATSSAAAASVASSCSSSLGKASGVSGLAMPSLLPLSSSTAAAGFSAGEDAGALRGRRRPHEGTSSRAFYFWCWRWRRLQARMMDGRSAHVTIKRLNHRISHESISLDKEKRLIKEIKTLEKTKPKVSSNAAKRAKMQDTVVERDAIQDQVKIIRDGIDGVKKERQGVRSKIKVLDDDMKVVDGEIALLQEDLNAATARKDKAYDSLTELRKLRDLPVL